MTGTLSDADYTERVARALFDALMAARPYVAGRCLPSGHPDHDWRSETACVVLDQVDGALADAQERMHS